jgi:DUF177 domain-containing protein
MMRALVVWRFWRSARIAGSLGQFSAARGGMSAGKETYGQLPATFDPFQLAERGARLTGRMPLKGLARLARLCVDDAGEAQVDIVFERGDNPNLAILHGTVTAEVRVTCQRCLEPMTVTIVGESRLVYLRPGEESAAPGGDDETIELERPVQMSELVEDELLLAMPMIPMHELQDCPARAYAAAAQGKPNPFAALRGRKPTKD